MISQSPRTCGGLLACLILLFTLGWLGLRSCGHIIDSPIGEYGRLPKEPR
jgi:hypothetical protein